AVRAGDVEAGDVDVRATPVADGDIERFKRDKRFVVDTATYGYSGPQQQLFFNYDTQLLRDRRVRKAIAHAIDLKALVNVVFFGYALVSPSPVSTALPKFYDPRIQAWQFDPKTAEQLLDEAGVMRG